MSAPKLFILHDSCYYVRVDPQKVSSELQSLKLALKFGNEKIKALESAMERLDDSTAEYDQLQDELNDYELMVSDFLGRADDLISITN